MIRSSRMREEVDRIVRRSALVVGVLCAIPANTTAQADSLASDTLSAVIESAGTGADSAAPQPEPVQQDRATLDEEIRAALQAVFDRVPSLAGVDVEVEAGVVHLGGTVPSDAAAERAVELAGEHDGVLFVDDQIELPTSLAERLRTTADRLREYGLDAIAALPLLVTALVIVILFGWLARGIGRWQGPAFLGRENPFLQGLFRRLLQLALFIAGLIITLDLLDATALVGAVLGTAGVAGLALGFAFKDIAENYLAGILLSLRQPFARNDHIVVGSHEGKVVRLTSRETILMTPDGNHVQVPNATVFREPLLNYTRNPRRRFSFEVGVAPETELTRALDAGLAALHDMKGVLDEPAPAAHVRALGDSTVTLQFRGWVDQRSAGFERVRSEAVRLIKLALEDAGIDMPSPEYRVQMREAIEDMADELADETRPADQASRTEQRDISVDTTIDEQIEEERQAGDEEEDLLEADGDGPGEPRS